MTNIDKVKLYLKNKKIDTKEKRFNKVLKDPSYNDCSVREIVCHLFEWYQQPEGIDFWGEIYDEIHYITFVKKNRITKELSKTNKLYLYEKGEI